MNLTLSPEKILSGQRTTGLSHLGHYFGILKNWVELQDTYECWFMLADLHALTTHYQNPWEIKSHVKEQMIDWLSCGIDPESSTVFLQSLVPQHAQMHVLLSMFTPLSWLERVPTFKEQQAQLHEKELGTLGFFGYPVLQTADIVLYQADKIPIGEDQLPHIELSREIVRRFNAVLGNDPDYIHTVENAMSKLGKKNKKLLLNLRKNFQEKGNSDDFETALALILGQGSLSQGEKDYLVGYLEGKSRHVLTEPEALLTPQSRLPGVDGQRKMSKSYGNAIALRAKPEVIKASVNQMPTDPARIRRHDPGNPDICPVFTYQNLYQDVPTIQKISAECRQAKIGCVDCKKILIDKMTEHHRPHFEKGLELESQPSLIDDYIQHGSAKARKVASEQLKLVEQALHLYGS